MKLIIITFLFINIYSSVYSNTIYYLTKIPNLKVHDLNSSNGIKYLKAEKFKFLFFKSAKTKGAPKHPVSSSKV